MRLLKYAILRLINREPITGYDISREFDRGLVNFWYATHSQIYPELRKLTEEGLVTFEIDTRGDRQEKNGISSRKRASGSCRNGFPNSMSWSRPRRKYSV